MRSDDVIDKEWRRRGAETEAALKRITQAAAIQALANGDFDLIPTRSDAPPRPDLSIPGERSLWWIVPPHTGLTGRMLPAKPQALDWGPKRAATWTS